MKEIIIICLIITSIIISSICVYNYLNKTSESIVNGLEVLKKEINKKEDTSEKEIIQSAERIKQNWNEIKEGWSNIVLHEELDSIETTLIKIKAKIEIGQKEESIEDIQTAIFLLEHIKEKEKINLKNIF